MRLGGRHWVIAGAITILTGWIPHAARAETGTLVLYGGAEASPDAAAQAARLVGELAPGVPLVDPPVHLAERFGQGPLSAVGGAEVQTCAATPADSAAYQGLLEELETAFTKLGDTATAFDQLQAAEACLSEPATTTSLLRARFIAGAAAFSEGDEAGARAAFEQVHAIDQDYAWDPNHSPTAQLLFADAKLVLLKSTPAKLHLALPADVLVWMDGRATTDRVIEALPGRHLIQVRSDAGSPMAALALDIAAGSEVVVLAPEALVRSAADDPDHAGRVEAVLRSLRAAGDTPPAILVDLTEPPAAWQLDGTGALSELSRVEEREGYPPGRSG